MEIRGDKLWHSPSPEELLEKAGETVTFKACVHNIRELGGVAFLVLRTGRFLIQSVYDKEVCRNDNALEQVAIGCCVRVTGLARAERRAENGVEVLLRDISVLSRPAAQLPLNLADPVLKATLGTKLEYRTAALRHPRERAVFRVQGALAKGFRDFLTAQGFVEIHTPKITGAGAEGGAEVFELEYFGQSAALAQSPQLYKQMCVAFFDRVFEVGAVYRAELHNTSRHLNEYTGLDFEMGYIDGMEDVMSMETAMLRAMMDKVRASCAPELALLGAQAPEIGAIPCVKFADALALLKTMGGGKNRNDLTPEDEALLCEYYKERGEGDFVFVTHFPTAKRPFYVMEDPKNPKETLSFDLLFRGLEITTGGQRIHDYDAQIAKMKARGMDPERFASYLSAHKGGLPPHGGLGIGLERLTMKLCGLANIREASLFPRDLTHLFA